MIKIPVLYFEVVDLHTSGAPSISSMIKQFGLPFWKASDRDCVVSSKVFRNISIDLSSLAFISLML